MTFGMRVFVALAIAAFGVFMLWQGTTTVGREARFDYVVSFLLILIAVGCLLAKRLIRPFASRGAMTSPFNQPLLPPSDD